jgi:hypothetical protein
VKITANKCLPLQLEKWTKCHIPLFHSRKHDPCSGFSEQNTALQRGGSAIDTPAGFLQIIANQWIGGH